MLKPTVKRGLMLDFINDEIFCPEIVNASRVYKINNAEISDGDVVYLMNREFRVEDNWGLLFAQELAKTHKKQLKIIIFVNSNYYSNHQEPFLLEGLNFLKKNLALNNFDFSISDKIPTKAGVIVFDFNPVNLHLRQLNESKVACYEVDSHNIIPARFVSDKQEYSAATLRRKIYGQISNFLTEYPHKFEFVKGGAYEKLSDFLENKLNYYAESKNNPLQDMTSNLSSYQHFGFISSQRIALEVLNTPASRENKEAFLEELIVRKELADNFCLHRCDFKTLKCLPSWAQDTLESHKYDIRSYHYDLSEFEYAKTHDTLWNKIQDKLLKTGRIHGYLRMYWAKKILEWSISPEEALIIAIYLNDTYAQDGMDSNGYVGILWSIGGIHDRAFTNRLVTGKIRYMGLEACKRNFDLKKFLAED